MFQVAYCDASKVIQLGARSAFERMDGDCCLELLCDESDVLDFIDDAIQYGRLPDLLMISLHLADRGASPLLQHIRRRSRTAGLPVVVLTANDHVADPAGVIADGASALLGKPATVPGWEMLAETLLSIWLRRGSLPRDADELSRDLITHLPDSQLVLYRPTFEMH